MMPSKQISMRLLPGLVSVTFRGLPPREIIALAERARLAGIEWGGDIHVPHGDLARAREVGAMTREAGLEVAAYGSYYKVGESEAAGLSFARVLETAQALGAPLIRVWAGNRGSADANAAYRRQVADEACRIAAESAVAGVGVAFEFHCGTLTDTAESAEHLLAATADAGLRGYWQPPVGWPQAELLASLNRLKPHLANLHVYHWLDSGERRPLTEGASPWLAYLRAAAPIAGGGPRWAMLEFVRDDSPAQMLEDAAVLVRLISQVESAGGRAHRVPDTRN
jgi:3-dehydroshikimate dehydratase